MTPLIDLSFSLLIFFMISYSASQGKLSEIVVNLPSAVQTGAYKQGSVVISVNDKNEIFLNDKKQNLDNLLSEMKGRKNSLKDQAVIIRGDRKSNYETIVKIMDILNQSGIPKFTLATVKPK